MEQSVIKKKIVVSLTSYPARIQYVSKALESIFTQSLSADEIVLYLAKEQFPNRENDFPAELENLVSEKKLRVRWCANDLKPHKKYFYAFRDYPEDVIVTIDDDLIYPPDMLKNLYHSYQMFPECVSASRVHLIFIENNKVLPYELWLKEINGCVHQPSMQLFATGGAGTLYPTHLFCKMLLDEKVIMETCLEADDLWLKAMELALEIPVVLASSVSNLRYVPGSQEGGTLWSVNRAENDNYWEKINKWYNEQYEDKFLVKKIASDVGVDLLGIGAISRLVNFERKREREKLRKAWDEKSERARRIRELEEELKAIKSSHI